MRERSRHTQATLLLPTSQADMQALLSECDDFSVLVSDSYSMPSDMKMKATHHPCVSTPRSLGPTSGKGSGRRQLSTIPSLSTAWDNGAWVHSLQNVHLLFSKSPTMRLGTVVPVYQLLRRLRQEDCITSDFDNWKTKGRKPPSQIFKKE